MHQAGKKITYLMLNLIKSEKRGTHSEHIWKIKMHTKIWQRTASKKPTGRHRHKSENNIF